MAVQLSRSAKLYQERRIPQDRTTRRLPNARTNLSMHPTHRIPFAPPYPTPEVLRKEQSSDPDAQLTVPWPHGEIVLR
jgi:hypothetical protein